MPLCFYRNIKKNNNIKTKDLLMSSKKLKLFFTELLYMYIFISFKKRKRCKYLVDFVRFKQIIIKLNFLIGILYALCQTKGRLSI